MKEIFLEGRGDYIEGAFVPAQGRAKKEHIIISPADRQDKVFRFFSDSEHLDLVCQSAVKAYPLWSSLSLEKRKSYLYRLARIYDEKMEDMAILISRETGKPLWESRLEAQALSQKIEVTLKESLPLVKDTAFSSLRAGARGRIAYRSRGVFLVLGPFNFPVHLPNGHIISALITGNTVIFKASEKSPASAEKLAECFHLAGFPKGVFNLIQGGSDTAQALVRSDLIEGVLFTGSYAVGQKIQKQVQDQPHKILALEMGGKNSALVWKDADVENAVYEILKGAYLTCGQRCSSTSRVILHKDIKEIFLKKFIHLSEKLKIGHWRNDPFMGPLIDKKAVDRFMSAGEEAEAQGAVIHLRGEHQDHLKGFYVRPAVVEPLEYDPHSFYQREELFAPFVAVYSVCQEEEAYHLINQGGYGLCLSVFSQNKKLAKRAFQKARVGVFHWNLSSNGASSRLPFGGLGKSGNDRPAGLFAVYTCVTPVSWLERESSKMSVFDKKFLME